MSANIITPQMLATRLGMGDLSEAADEVSATLQGFINGAGTRIQRYLRTTFDFESGLIDIFRVNVDRYWSTLPDDLAPLRLSRGFVSPGSVSLKFNVSLSELLDAQGETIASADVFKDYERGVLKIPATTYDKQYVRVSYDAGFENPTSGGSGSAEPPEVDPSVPGWLQEAFYVQAIELMNQEQSKDPTKTEDAALASTSLDDLLLAHTRINVPFCFNPIR